MDTTAFDPVSKFHFHSYLNWEILPPPARELLEKNRRELTFKKNEVIYAEGSFPKGLYIIKKGVVKVLFQNEDGSVQIIYFYISDELFGYRPLLCNEAHPVTTMAMVPTIVNFIPAGDFLSALRQSNELTQQILFFLSKEFSMWVNRINVFAQRNVRQRLALALLILHEKLAETKNGSANIFITRTDLSNYIGTKIEVIVRILHEFEKEGLINTHGKEIQITDRMKLYRMAQIA